MHRSEDYASSSLDGWARKHIAGLFLPKQVFDIADLLSKEIELSSQALNVGSGASVHVEIEFTAQAINFPLQIGRTLKRLLGVGADTLLSCARLWQLHLPVLVVRRTGELGDFGYCHCTSCRKASGSMSVSSPG